MYPLDKTLDEIINEELKSGTPLNLIVNRFRDVIIRKALAKSNNDKVNTAYQLQVHRTTLDRYIDKLGMRI